MAENLTVEGCLTELQKIFPDKCCYIDQNISASIGRHGQHLYSRIEIQIDADDGSVLYHGRSTSLNDAMAQIRTWKERE